MSTINNGVGVTRQQLAQEGVAYSIEIALAATRHGLDPQLLAAVAAQETGGPGSNAGANIVGDGGHGRGIFQIDDRWHALAKTAAAMDPAKNADYAARMLVSLLKRYGADPSNPSGKALHEALSAYNAGSPNAKGTLTRWADGQILGYADSVVRHMLSLRGPHHGRQQTSAMQIPSTLSSLPSQDRQNLLGELLSEIQQTNQLRTLSQASPLRSATPAAQPTWAGIIDSADNSTP